MSNKFIAWLEILLAVIIVVKFIGEIIAGTLSATIIASGIVLTGVMIVMVYKDVIRYFKKD